MSEFSSFSIPSDPFFKSKLVSWADRFSTFCFLDSNEYLDRYGKYDFIIGIDAINFHSSFSSLESHKFQFGYLRYDYNIEKFDIRLEIDSYISFEKFFFFTPRYVVYQKDNRIFINRNMLESMEILDMISKTDSNVQEIPKVQWSHRTSKNDYISNIRAIQDDIRNGKFYELNYCQEIYSNEVHISPISTFLQINAEAKSPMSALFKQNDKWILSFSPERMIAVRGNEIIAQPIKGTAKRDLNSEEIDNQIKKNLESSKKERAENSMIVDLMRHDLTPFAKTGSIIVDELCGIYTFPFVHQMISTIRAELVDVDTKFMAIENTIPAGSMTGAPKKEVMKYIDKYENFNRGIYAGNIGYVDEDGDVDFSVVIRTLFYDSKSKRLSLAVGGAITLLSEAENEYDECELKAEGILKFFR